MTSKEATNALKDLQSIFKSKKALPIKNYKRYEQSLTYAINAIVVLDCLGEEVSDAPSNKS